MSDTKTKVTVIVPLVLFREILRAVLGLRECNQYGCPYDRAECRLSAMETALQAWWTEANGDAPGFSCYQEMFLYSVRYSDTLHDHMFFGHNVAEDVHRTIADRVRTIFLSKQVA